MSWIEQQMSRQKCTAPCGVCGKEVRVEPGAYFGIFCIDHGGTRGLTEQYQKRTIDNIVEASNMSWCDTTLRNLDV